MKILNYIIASIRLLLVMLTMLFYYIWFLLTVGFKKDKLAWGIHVQTQYTHAALLLFGTRYTFEGQPYDGTALYISNHRSLLDPVVIRNQVDALGVAKAEIESYPLLGKAVEATGIIFVRRDDRNSRADAKDAIVQHLQKGYSVLLFPEGTVSGERTTLPFKKGGFEKAIEANVPVVPITLIYNDPKFHWFKISTMEYYFNSFGLHTPNVHMVIGQPIFEKSVDKSLAQTQATINDVLTRH